jgi:NAD(P)-dependent dehydrogenase (short-subunit alcohol dehydrogenase family)
MRLKDKVIPAIGSTAGIGDGMARVLVREGAAANAPVDLDTICTLGRNPTKQI